MKAFKTMFFLVVFAGFSFYVFAADTSDGCGLGWKVNDDMSLLGTTTRGTTHATTFPTSSMTTGTSGCAKHSIVKKESRGIHYAEANYANLMVEMSQGKGEFLAGFANVLGCQEAQTQFGEVMRQNYRQIYTSDDISAMDMYHNVLEQIKGHQDLSGKCRTL